MNSKSRISEILKVPGLVLFSAVLMLGCERPLPDADKNPESRLELPQAPQQRNHGPLPQERMQQRNTVPRTLVTLRQTECFVS